MDAGREERTTNSRKKSAFRRMIGGNPCPELRILEGESGADWLTALKCLAGIIPALICMTAYGTVLYYHTVWNVHSVLYDGRLGVLCLFCSSFLSFTISYPILPQSQSHRPEPPKQWTKPDRTERSFIPFFFFTFFLFVFSCRVPVPIDRSARCRLTAWKKPPMALVCK